MSKNRNRKRTAKALTKKEYKAVFNLVHRTDCIICARRAGTHLATCYPVRYNVGYRRGFKNPHKGVSTAKAREFRSWKHNRKTKWKM